MKIIKNKERLEFILSNENPEWQKIVYEKTGVIAYFNNSNTGDCYIDLISFCGYIDAEIDSYNSSGYCEILSISSFIENILQAKSYTQYLKDVSLGVFSKSQLYWNVYSQILRAKENLQHKHDDFLLSSITCIDDAPIHHIEEEINLNMEYIGVDELNCYIEKSDSLTIASALTQILNEIKAICDDDDSIQNYKVYPEYRITPPQTFDELKDYIERYRILPQQCHEF